MSVLKYGLKNVDLSYARYKIAKQSDYLDKEFITAMGQIKTLRDVSFSANHSTRYYAQLLNKVNTLDSYNTALGNIPIFLTITLDGFFRDLVQGDYTRFTSQIRYKYLKFIPNNERFGFILDKMDEKKALSFRDCYQILNFQARRFFRSNTFQKMPKFNEKHSYIRNVEPHKDGIPHFHILLYIPPHALSNLHKNYKDCFPAPQNHKKLNISVNGRASSIIDDVAETQGFQFKINKPIGYILKYVLKSFSNVSEGKEIDYLQAWYIIHKIPRIVTSHTIIPAWVYQKVSVLESDWFYLNDVHKNYEADWSSEFDYFEFSDGHGRVITYHQGEYKIINNGEIVEQFGIKKKILFLANAEFSTTAPLTYSLLHFVQVHIPRKQLYQVSSQIYRDRVIASTFVESIHKLYDFDAYEGYEYFIDIASVKYTPYPYEAYDAFDTLEMIGGT